MIKNVVSFLKDDIIATVEGLIGTAPAIEDSSTISDIAQLPIDTPHALANIGVDGRDSTIKVAFSANVCTALSDMMLGGDGVEKDDMDDDDLDATKELISNIFGAFSSRLKGQNEIPQMSFATKDIEFKPDAPVKFDDIKMVFAYPINISNAKGYFLIGIDEVLLDVLVPKKQEVATIGNATESFTKQELHNIGLIREVKLPIRVRIGSKQMLLKDILNMDIGSVIELDQLANDPLDIIVGDKVIAVGEVVIIDGNFGIQISEIVSKRERLQNIRP